MALTRLNTNAYGSTVNLASNVTGTLANSNLAAGNVIQVVSATDTTQRTTTSTSFVTASNTLSVDITPSATSSKIFVIVSTTFGLPSGANGVATIKRDSTNLEDTSDAGLAAVSASTGSPVVMSILDSPSSTSELTYQVYMKTSTSSGYINYGAGKVSITAYEISG